MVARKAELDRYVRTRLLEMERENISAPVRRRLRDYAQRAEWDTPVASDDAIDRYLVGLSLIAMKPRRFDEGLFEVVLTRAGKDLARQFDLRFAGMQKLHRFLCERFVKHLHKAFRPPETYVTAKFERWLKGERIVVCPDVLTVSARGVVTLYEMKRSRADYRRHCEDSYKLQASKNFANRLYFVAPPNIISRDVLPSGWGVIIEGPVGEFVTRVAAKRVGGYLRPQDREMLATAR